MIKYFKEHEGIKAAQDLVKAVENAGLKSKISPAVLASLYPEPEPAKQKPISYRM